ncbi:MAG: FG-GAP-like repeat-containing protein, partial [Bacteroidota bacterium]
INGDGRADVLSADFNAGSFVNIVTNNQPSSSAFATANFIGTTAIASMGSYANTFAADLDNDGKPDFASFSDSKMTIGRNKINEDPTITVAGTLNSFTQCLGNPSARQTITVSGQFLTAPISFSALTNFQYSLNDTTYASTLTLTPVSGSVAPRTIFIRYNNTIAGSNSGNISLTSTGATTVNVAASGTCIALPTVASTTPASRFCTGTVTLAATASAGTINWYAAQTGGSSLFTGNSFTTPSISTTTTYFVDATNNGCTTATRTGVTATINSAAITVQPVPQTICGPTSPLSLSVNATGGGTLTYQWRKGLSNIPG